MGDDEKRAASGSHWLNRLPRLRTNLRGHSYYPSTGALASYGLLDSTWDICEFTQTEADEETPERFENWGTHALHESAELACRWLINVGNPPAQPTFLIDYTCGRQIVPGKRVPCQMDTEE